MFKDLFVDFGWFGIAILTYATVILCALLVVLGLLVGWWAPLAVIGTIALICGFWWWVFDL